MQLELWPETPQVTEQEIHEWVREIGFNPESWRGKYYIKNWNVADKIAEIKRRELRRLTHRAAPNPARRSSPKRRVDRR